MSLEGSAFVSNGGKNRELLKEGAILKPGDVVEVDDNSYVDLAYDKEWNNITRIEKNSKITIQSIYPTALAISKGGLYAKLKKLPKDSTFEVITPTAIAAARGTEYRTTYENDISNVYNFSDSKVYVFGADEQGRTEETPLVLENDQQTEITKFNRQARIARRMSEEEFRRGRFAGEGIENNLRGVRLARRIGRMQDIGPARKFNPIQPKRRPLRRRPFSR